MKIKNKLTGPQIAGYRAAHTRRVQRLDEQVLTGVLTSASAAGYKAASKRRLNEVTVGA